MNVQESDMHPVTEYFTAANRRSVLRSGVLGCGTAALSGLLQNDAATAESSSRAEFPQFTPKAKRVIHLCQSGAPSQLA